MNNPKRYCYRLYSRALSQMGVDMMAGLVLGAVIYPIGRVLVTTLDGFCIVIGLKRGGWIGYWKAH